MRNKTFDSLKYYAIFLVIIGHFFNYRGVAAPDWVNVFPLSFLLREFSGRTGVLMFGVIMGYFAFRSGKKKEFIPYVLKRYLYFVLWGFVINGLYYLFNIDGIRTDSNFNLVIGQSVLLGKLIFPAYWFVLPFFEGSILSFIAGKLKLKAVWILAVALAILFLKQEYIAVVVLGALLDEILEKHPPYFEKAGVQLLLCIVSLLLLFQRGHYFSLFFQGIGCAVIVVLFMYNKLLHKAGENGFTCYFGKLTMAILILHLVCMNVIDGMLDMYHIDLPYFLIMALWLVSVHLLSVPLDALIGKIYESLCGFFDSLYGSVTKKINRKKG